MDNMERIINAHNKKILQKTTPAADNCNCKNPENCPLTGNCRTKNIVYQADVTSKHESKVLLYILDYAKQSLKQDIIITSHHFPA